MVALQSFHGETKMTTLFQETIEHLLKSHNLLEDFQTKDSFSWPVRIYH